MVTLCTSALTCKVRFCSCNFARACFLLDVRPPHIDVLPDLGQRGLLFVEVKAQRAAAARGRVDDRLDAKTIEHPGRRLIDAGQHRALHTGVEHQHLAGMAPRRPGTGGRHLRHLGADGCRQHRPHLACQLEQAAEQRSIVDQPHQQLALQALRQRPLDLLLDQIATDVEQT